MIYEEWLITRLSSLLAGIEPGVLVINSRLAEIHQQYLDR